MRITKIEMSDFRGIKGPNAFTLDLGTTGKSLLLYGENGAGKSTIMQSIDRIVRNRDHDVGTDANRFRRSASETALFVTATLSDGSRYTYGNSPDVCSPEVEQALMDAQLRCGFLGYKELLRTSFYSGLAQHTLFRLVVEDLLADHRILIGGSSQPVKVTWERLKNDKPIRMGRNNVPAYRERIHVFNDALSAAVNDVEGVARTLLEYFDHQSVQLRLRCAGAQYTDKGQLLDGTITPVVEFGGEQHTDFSDWLNEARLSCLALCLHLASVKRRDVVPLAGVEPLRVLCLDDVLIGLDMGNRRPVLKLLNEHFADFQVFLTTYDRHWFEVAKKELGDNWLKAELYEGEDAQGHFRPILITPSMSDYEHARFYFDRKDYAASANYLRKVCEAEICRVLPLWRRRNAVDTGAPYCVTNLQDLHSRLISFLQESGIDPVQYRVLDVIKGTILNPFSHANMASPLYRGELLETFAYVEGMRKLRTLEMAKAEAELTITKKSADDAEWEYVVQLKEPLNLFDADGTFGLTRCEARPRSLRKDGQIQPLKEQDGRLDLLYERYCHFCKVLKGSLEDDFVLADGRSLSEKRRELLLPA